MGTGIGFRPLSRYVGGDLDSWKAVELILVRRAGGYPMRQAVLVILLVGPLCALLAPAGDGPKGDRNRPKGDRLAKAVPVVVDGKPLERERGGLYPFVGDYYGDGRLALLLGYGDRGMCDEGRLLVYRNVGTKVNPRLGAPRWFDDVLPTGRIPGGG
jgi:hypothetical protein